MSKKQQYKGKEIVVHFDAERCMHAGLCVRTLPKVFESNAEGPWIHPDAADVDALVALIESCPSGALRYDKESQREQAPQFNSVTVEKDGPLTIHANFTLNGVKPDSPRATLCRCGASKNQPYCDDSHGETGFSDAGELVTSNPDDPQESGLLEIKTLKNGPLYLLGPHTIYDASGAVSRVCKKSALCRCGATKMSPNCDASHASIDFKAD
ncbi:MAG: CDGSH iron-sulfur domain-containing protein [Mariprofundus sp.]|nr:CDGSH iron-sulfur domain-containing protein [Mariprofundus sp.]